MTLPVPGVPMETVPDEAGAPQSTIILAIQNTSVKFDVSAEGILALHAGGVTEPVLNHFGVLFTGTGAAWVDTMKVELDGAPYSNPQFDFDFESTTAKGFYTGGPGYKVGVDTSTSYTGHQSLKMLFVGDGAAAK